jgi:hypothetical protein
MTCRFKNKEIMDKDTVNRIVERHKKRFDDAMVGIAKDDVFAIQVIEFADMLCNKFISQLNCEKFESQKEVCLLMIKSACVTADILLLLANIVEHNHDIDGMENG